MVNLIDGHYIGWFSAFNTPIIENTDCYYFVRREKKDETIITLRIRP